MTNITTTLTVKMLKRVLEDLLLDKPEVSDCFVSTVEHKGETYLTIVFQQSETENEIVVGRLM